MLVFIFFFPLTSPIVCFLSGPGLQGLQSKQTSSFTAVCSSAQPFLSQAKDISPACPRHKTRQGSFLNRDTVDPQNLRGLHSFKKLQILDLVQKKPFFFFFFKFKVSLNPKYAFVWRLMAFRTKRTTCR